MTFLSLVVYSFILQNYGRRGKLAFVLVRAARAARAAWLFVCIRAARAATRASPERERAGTSPALSPPPTGFKPSTLELRAFLHVS